MEDGMDESSSGEWESSTDSSSSSSSEDSSLGGSDSSSSSSEESAVPSIKLEDCKVNGALLKLPQGLCEQEDVFQQLLSLETWQSLSAANKEHLKKFLPTFQSNNDIEQETTLQLLLNGENIRFGNPLKDFHRNLKNGYYRPDIARMRRLLRKALNREYNYSQKRYYFRVMKSVLVSRQKLLQAANVLPPGMNPKVPRLPAPPKTQHMSTRDFRTRRRYFQELRAVRQEVGESGHSSEDENYPEGPPAQMNKKLKRRLSVLETSICPEMRKVVSTLAAKPAGLDLASNVTLSNNPYELSDEAYRNMLIRHKKRRLSGDTHPELNCIGRSLHDVVDRANRVMSKKGLPIIMKFESVGKPTSKPLQKRRNSKAQPEAAVPSPSPLMMADSSESDDDDVISVTRLLDNIDKAQRAQMEKMAIDKEKDNDKDAVRGRERDKEQEEREREKEKDKAQNKEKERDEWDRFIENDAEKFPASSTLRSSATKPKKISAPRSSKPNNLSGLPTSRQILKGELEDAVDSLLNSGANPSIPSSSDTKPPKVQSQLQQSLQMSTHKQKLQEQLKEEDVGVKVVQATSFPATQDTSLLPDLSNIDMMSLPIDIEDPEPEVNVEDLPATPSLMQETHSCFFALLRDLICSAKEQSMSLSNLQAGLRRWQESPISPLNDWYPQAANSGGWVVSLTSALTFLSGQLPDMHPDEFVPYLEYKPSIRKYQWIGAGRDSDNLLMPLCTYWLERRDEAAEMQSKANKNNPKKDSIVETENNIYVDDEEMGVYLPVDPTNDYSDRLDSPPPSCNPTDWVVRPTTLEEKQQFRAQELERFANPLRAFTYKMHGYDSVVGPLRGVYSTGSINVKPRGHSLLVSDRPNYVTILALVRDAVARLPNGQGTRMDICELLKDSQYLKPGATEQTVQSVVSGALDRLHYEPDPCVKYEPKRKIWICLHRNRTMEEYEQMHQLQGLGKSKYRKSGGRVKKEKDLKAETKAAVAAVTSGVTSTPRQIPQVEAEVTNMPTGLHTIQVTTRPAASLTSGSLWNTPMEIPMIPSNPSSASAPASSVSSLSSTSTIPSQSARTILSARLPPNRKSVKKQTGANDGVESNMPISGTNVRSVLGTSSTDVVKTTQQQILVGGRLITSTPSRKSLVMTSSGGVSQVVQLATPTKSSLAGSGASSQATLLVTGSPTTSSNIQTVCSTPSTSQAQWTTIATSPSQGQRQPTLVPQSQAITPKKPTETKRPAPKSNDSSTQALHLPSGIPQTISLDQSTQRQLKQQQLLMLKQRQQQVQQQQVAQHQAAQQASQQQAAQQQAAQQQASQQQAAQQQAAQQQAAQQQAAQQQAAQQQAAQQHAAQQQTVQQPQQQQIQHQQQLQLQLQEQQLQQQQQQQQQIQQQQQKQQQLQLQQQFQAQQLQQVQPTLQAIQPQGHELEQRIQTLELDQKQQEQLQQQVQQLQQQKQQLQIQQKVALSTSQKQLQQQTLQLIQQQLKEKSGALSLSNIQLVDQSGTVMAVQTSESQNTVGRPRQNLVLVRQAGNDQSAQLTAMLQKQQQLLLLKQKQQSIKDLSEAQQQQLQLRQKQVQDMLKQQLKAQQASKVQTASAQPQIQQQLVVVSGSPQQQVKQQLSAQQKQTPTQLVVLKQPRGQGGQLVNTVGGILPQQMFVVKTKTGAGQKQVLTQLTAEQQAGLLALQRQQQQQQQQQSQQIQIQQQQSPQQLQSQQQQQTVVQQSQLSQQPPPLQLQHQSATTGIAQLQLSDQSQQQRQQIQQVLQSQGKNVRGTSILGQGILTTAALTSSTVTTPSAKQGPPPMVAKVVTNSQGQQLITMEAFQAQNKGTLRVAPAGGKGQPNQLIQLAGSGAGGVPQFAVVSQGNIISLASSINTQRLVPQTLTLSASATTTTAVTASKVSTGTINAAVAQPSGNLRMVGGAGLNIAHIGGKPVLLASKQQGLQGQNVILTSPSGGQQTVLLASQPLRPASSVSGATNQQTATATTSNAVVLQQAGGTQQILLPAGFQGGTINLKGIQGIQGLQGLKVIPVAQAATPDGTKGRSQMFARIISPSTVRATGVQQSAIAVAVAGAGTAGTTTVAAASAPGVTAVSSNKEQTNL